MYNKTLLFLIVTCLTCLRAQFLGNLGHYINSEVQNALKPLEGLDQRIRNEVNQQVSGHHVQLQQSLAPLNNLGDRIKGQVEKDLEPVYIMTSKFKVMAGEDGTTIATFNPSGKTFVIRDGVTYTCSKTISDLDGTCLGSLDRLKYDKREDFCYTRPNSVINSWYCISSSGSSISNYYNGELTCESNDGSPVLKIKAGDYRNMCQNLAASADYKYFTTNPLTHFGDGLECSGNQPQVCTLKDSSRLNNYVGATGVTFISS